MTNLGTVRPGSTISIPWDTFAGATGASITSTGIAVTDIEVYKDSSITQRASDSGYALVDTDGIDIDGTTGIQEVTIDLADNTTAGFWAAGSRYRVVIASVTIDGQTVNFTPVIFQIGYPNAIINTTIATLASQTSFTLTSGPAEDDALNGMWVIIHDVASAVQLGQAVILDYTGATKTVTLAVGTTFTAAATDNVSIMGPSPLQPAVSGRTLGVESSGKVSVLLADTVTNLTNAPTVGDLTATMKTSVNTEVLDVLNVDAFAQPGQATPAATTSIRLMLAWLYKAWRNRTFQNATDYELYNDDAVTVDQKAGVTIVANTSVDREEVITGP